MFCLGLLIRLDSNQWLNKSEFHFFVIDCSMCFHLENGLYRDFAASQRWLRNSVGMHRL